MCVRVVPNIHNFLHARKTKNLSEIDIFFINCETLMKCKDRDSPKNVKFFSLKFQNDDEVKIASGTLGMKNFHYIKLENFCGTSSSFMCEGNLRWKIYILHQQLQSFYDIAMDAKLFIKKPSKESFTVFFSRASVDFENIINNSRIIALRQNLRDEWRSH